MKYLLLNIALALAWTALTGVLTYTNLFVGFGLGYLVMFFVRRTLDPLNYFAKAREVIEFALFFIYELVLANARVTRDVLAPRYDMQPRIIAIPLDVQTDAEITALAYFISLTPGTVCLDVSADRRVLFIHAMHAPDADALRHTIKQGLERRLLNLIRGSSAERG